MAWNLWSGFGVCALCRPAPSCGSGSFSSFDMALPWCGRDSAFSLAAQEKRFPAGLSEPFLRVPGLGVRGKRADPGFVTHPGDLRTLVPDITWAPPQKAVERFFDVHGKVPFVQAAEETIPYETPHFNQVRPEMDKDFDQCVSW